LRSAPLIDPAFLRQLEQLSLESLGRITDGLAGAHAGRRSAHLLEFSDYRRYAPGDDPRLIDWNAYARLRELFIKTSPEREDTTLLLLIDCSRSMDWGRPHKLRYAKRVAAALGAVALLDGDSVQVHGLGDRRAIPGGRATGAAGLHTLLESLEALPSAIATDLPASVRAYRREADRHDTTVLLSDLLIPPEHDEALDWLGTAGAVVHVIDPADGALSIDGPVELLDRETGEVVTTTMTPQVSERYRSLAAERSRALASRCSARNLRYLAVETTTPIPELIFGTFLRDGMLRRPD
jgi:uncharacterized protein (DUF58 family)